MARRLKKFGLFASGLTTKLMSDEQKRQYVLEQISKDAASKHPKGSRRIKQAIAEDAGVLLTR